jgi:hypothetical protein
VPLDDGANGEEHLADEAGVDSQHAGDRDAGEWIVARERERLGSAADRQRTGEMRVVDEDGRDGIGWAAVAGAGTSGSAVDAYASMSPRRMA